MIVRHTTIAPIPELLRSIARPVRCARRRYSTRPPPLKLDLLQSHALIRRIDPGSDAASSPKQSESDIKPEDFVYYPNFFSPEEQAILVRLALWKLDRVDSKKKRTRRRRSSTSTSTPAIDGEVEGNGSQAGTSNLDLQALFEDPSVYGFEEGHFDSVITSYRESLLTAFPEPSVIHPIVPYPAILKRVYGLLPASPGAELARGLYESLVLPVSGSTGSVISQSITRTTPSSTSNPNAYNPSGEDWEPFAAPLQTTTHALHLSPTGRIDPHVDNVDASGSVIIGVSLGAERVLRLERNGAESEGRDGWEVLLKSGSVYIQKDTVRYNYAHSILPYSSDRSVDAEGERLRPGHRISLMIRVSLLSGCFLSVFGSRGTVTGARFWVRFRIATTKESLDDS
ncbi:hypothetical protein HD553DRAFT_21475 [Filobasidium floriforme]|uniref:uncharacterized protein n=1 Tax=Filobasidium floriforme TaxID=5210 RepID=UPI001E8DD987|nr:uncharacterized protein HD553DRAFT_21475 [Filobasidium floriforme]KAH8090958.1 hypothetical protein HD553DRAFT_21475 [Filobasidium floriforme]